MTFLQDKHTCIRYKFNISSHFLMIDHYIQWFNYNTYMFNVFEKFLIYELEVKTIVKVLQNDHHIWKRV